ncbi:MAG: hypothetical protein MHMPM18_004331 [Marteilia pararefringens]
MNIWRDLKIILTIFLTFAPNNSPKSEEFQRCLSALKTNQYSRSISDFVLKTLCLMQNIDLELNDRVVSVGMSNIVRNRRQIPPEITFMTLLAQNKHDTNGWIVCTEIQNSESIYALKFREQKASRNFSRLLPIYSESVNEKLFPKMVLEHTVFSNICRVAVNEAKSAAKAPQLSIAKNLKIYTFQIFKAETG